MMDNESGKRKNDKIIQSIMVMLKNIDKEAELIRIHNFIQRLYLK